MKRLLAWCVDLVLVLAASASAFVLRRNFDVGLEDWVRWAPHASYSLLAAAVLIPLFGLNRSIWRFSSTQDYGRIALVSVLIVATALIASYAAAQINLVSRAFAIIQAILIFVFLGAARVYMRLRHENRGQRPSQFNEVTAPANPGSVLLVGVTRLAELYLRAAEEHAAVAPAIAGLLGLRTTHMGRGIGRYPVLGTPDEVERIVQDLGLNGVRIDRIVVTSLWQELSPAAQEALLRLEAGSEIKLIVVAEALDLPVRDATDPAPSRADGAEAMGARPGASPSSDEPPIQRPADVAWRSVPAMAAQSAEGRSGWALTAAEQQAIARRLYWPIKRALDILGAAVLLVLTAPLMIGVALAVLIDMGRPILFWQQRPGLGGHPFRVYKFRTMTSGHDAAGAHLSDAQRTTRLGRFLRASRLDELPQLVQVLVGEMSFVGPRPLLPRDQPEGSEARLLVRPGLTGWAQINGGRSVAAPDKVALDIWYVRHASLWLDVTIVLRTLLFVLRGEPTDRAETASRPPLTGVKPISAGRPVSGAMAGPEPAPALVRGAPARRPSSLL